MTRHVAAGRLDLGRQARRRRTRWAALLLALAATTLGVPTPVAAAPVALPRALSPLDCVAWRYGPADEPASLPSEYDRNDYKRTSLRDSRLALRTSPQNLCGQKGAAVDLAWGLSTGSPSTLIAVLDSGIRWRDAGAMDDLATKAHINLGEARPPCHPGVADGDCNNDDLFDIRDFGAIADRNGNGRRDPEDLILDPAVSDGVDDDGDGYVDNVSGWDFLYGDNNAFDTVSYGHGTGEALDSTAAPDNGRQVGGCPRCMFLPVRVSDSFIADGGRFAAGVLYALDEGADVIQEALGSLNNPSHAQAAIDAAYERGVVVVASMADEAGVHPNLPAALERTMTVNSVTERHEEPLDDSSDVEGYLALNGCTNFGGRTFVSVPSDGCSSEATGQSAGMIGLVESFAREEGLTPHPSLAGLTGPQAGDVLTANEVMQLVRASADDIDFATPNAVDPANNFGTSTGDPLFDTVRYPTRRGWDMIHGYGRINAYELLKAVEAEAIPPEAMIDGPHWFDLLPTTGTVAVTGAVAAERATSYDYRVEWAPGVQPPAHPGTDTWTVAGQQSGLTAPKSGTLATLDLASIAAALPGGGAGPPVDADDGRPAEERFSVRLRVMVTAHGGPGDGLTGEMQKQVFVHDDPDLVDGYPARIDGVGAASPSFTDVDGDGTTELVVGTDDGDVHAYRPDGSEIPGFPLQTQPSPWWPTGSGTATADGIPPLRGGLMLGGPAIGDLDEDDDNELVVGDLNGRIQVFSHTGTPGATMTVNPDYSRDDPAAQDSSNRTKRGFLSTPSLGDLDGDGDLEIVAAALDRHVYAWHHDGTPVTGFPVLVVDPAKVASVDPTTHKVTFVNGSGVEDGGELLATPALADITGDGRPEIILGAQEQYSEAPNIGDGAGAVAILQVAGRTGNSRVYAISPDGTTATTSPPSAQHPHAQAYLPGWPAKVAMAATNLLPIIGNGVSMPVAVGDVDTSTPGAEILVASSAGPVYAFDRHGDSVFGTGPGGDIPFFWSAGIGGEDKGKFGANRNSEDLIVSMVGFGAPTIGDLAGDGALEVTAPTAGLTRLIDLLVPDLQLPNDDQLSMWDGTTRMPLAGSPQATSDLAFFVAPAVADLDGDGDQESIAGSSTYLISAFDGSGAAPAGWPKLTGGWSVGTPAVGDWDGDGSLEVAQPRRDGVLLVWTTGPGTAREGAVAWSQWGCDALHAGSCVDAAPGAARYVDRLYELVLGRPADPGGREYWTARLAAGTDRSRPIRALMATGEARRAICDRSYRLVLGRPGDTGGLTWCAGRLAAGADITDVRAVLAASDEMWKRGGRTADGYLDLLYERILGRPVDAGARSYWRSRLDGGSAAARHAVTRAVLHSTEAQGRLVDEQFRLVLERPVDPGGRSYWVRRLQRDLTDVQLFIHLLASDELYRRSTG